MANSTRNVLLLTETTAFRHPCAPVNAAMIHYLGARDGRWRVVREADTSQEVTAAFAPSMLETIDLVVLANTSGDLSIPPSGLDDFFGWVGAGGGVVGIHSGLGSTFPLDARFLDLVRGTFEAHGPEVEVEVINQDQTHPACRSLPDRFSIFEEIYEFKGWRRDSVHTLLSMPRHPQTHAPGDFPVAWTNTHGSGRMFYTSLGHREDVYSNPLYLDHLAGGIRWALGLEDGSDAHGNELVT